MAASFSSAALASPPAARPSETSPLLAPNRPSPAASLKADAAAADQNDLQWSFIGPDDGRLHGTRLIVTLCVHASSLLARLEELEGPRADYAIRRPSFLARPPLRQARRLGDQLYLCPVDHGRRDALAPDRRPL